ncbi:MULTISPECIES: hypothetical protein [Moorena]|uniref:Uncharacterized protein n=1 Tax=Moorena producens 3L TaxID=489825 RepID=F4XN15_9CYAN|nr:MULTISPECIES: hypothetical protein [Moorena]EGJ34074.1 hypothetical protein LYNGBM3L_23270 [Moorena producens 3L]NEP32718.1 hypothetical protein [Moorena sp. SIO3B2]NER85582.1 hypothetical protein [Moorena sp. SIO3A2]NET64705.1 hypothetical protein [Moorena sp. SIO1G6]OLT65053.1 hypothetical protein BI334_08420 [Moorena producens 3L]
MAIGQKPSQKNVNGLKLRATIAQITWLESPVTGYRVSNHKNNFTFSSVSLSSGTQQESVPKKPSLMALRLEVRHRIPGKNKLQHPPEVMLR